MGGLIHQGSTFIRLWPFWTSTPPALSANSCFSASKQRGGHGTVGVAFPRCRHVRKVETNTTAISSQEWNGGNPSFFFCLDNPSTTFEFHPTYTPKLVASHRVSPVEVLACIPHLVRLRSQPKAHIVRPRRGIFRLDHRLVEMNEDIRQGIHNHLSCHGAW